MNYLYIAFTDISVSVGYNNNKYDYTFDTVNSTYHDWLNIAKKINSDFQLIDGGVIQRPVDGDGKKSYVIKTQDNKTIDVANLFTESLNKPFIIENIREVNQQNSLERKFIHREKELTWSIEYSGLTSGKDEYCQESLLTVANGYIGLRGTLPEMTASHDYYPATYIAGLYNQATSQVNDHQVVNEDFVNAPNGQFISLKIGDGDYIHPNNVTTLALTRHLDFKTGVLSSDWLIETTDGKQLNIRCFKFANMANMSHYCLHYQFIPLNFSGEMTLLTRLEGNTCNAGVERYRSLNQNHYSVLEGGAKQQNAYLLAQTHQSKIGIGLASSLCGDFFSPQDIICHFSDSVVEQSIIFNAQKNTPYTVEKSVALTTSTAYPDNWQDITKWELPSWQTQLAETKQAWQTLWDEADIAVSGDLMTQKLLRLHTYHLLSSASPFSNEKNKLDVSVTARGLHGEAYRGHIFWDEIFIFPFYIMHFPDTARQLLLYRYRRLETARLAAKAAGFQGAMFPWQSGHDGTEQTQVLHLNPLSGQWDPDHSCRQRHVSLAIAYNVWLYWRNTLDNPFMKEYGLELLNDITLFWLGLCQWDEQDQRFHISGVMGPDEFHEKYADAQEGGLKDNAYTNLMVAWLFNEMTTLYRDKRFTDKLSEFGFSANTLDKLCQIKTQLAVTLNQDDVIEQFAGYFALDDLDWESYRQKYGNIYRMDRILRKENKSADDFKVAKQADTLMLFNNLDKTTVKSLIESLGHSLSESFAEKNLHYYLKRTSHGSTLSRIVHAYLAEQIQLHDLSWQLYQDALYSDYNDIQGGTTAEGIHTGVMAATLNTTIMAYAGVDIRQDILNIAPSLPKQWQGLSFKLRHQCALFHIKVTYNNITVMSDKACTISINNHLYSLVPNTPLSLNSKEGNANG